MTHTTDHHDMQTHPQPDGRLRRTLLSGLLLVLILIGGGALRFTGLDWDNGKLLHPDGRFLAWVTGDIYFSRAETFDDPSGVDSLREYFNTPESTLNPNNVGHGFYVYGNLPPIVTRWVGEQLGQRSMYELYLLGRQMAALADLLTILVVFLAARRLFNDARAGLLGAALYAFAAFPIQQSHFYTVDTFTNLFTMAALWMAARAFHRHSWLDYPLFGLFLGLAMASKISVFPMAVVLIGALGLRVWRNMNGEDAPVPLPRLAARAGIGLVIAGLVTVFVFRVAMPYAFLPPSTDIPIDAEALGGTMATLSRLLDPIGMRPNPDWLRQMKDVQFQVSGYFDSPPNHQWAHRLPLVFPWMNMVRVGMGWPLGVFAWLAFAWALWEIGRGHSGSLRLALPVLWIALFFTWQGIGWVKTMRYFLPVYGPLLMLTGWALVTVWDRVSGLLARRNARVWHPARMTVAGLAISVLLAGGLWGFAVSRIYTRPNTRVAASEWMVENVPGDVTLYIETENGPRTYQISLRSDWPPIDEFDSNPDVLGVQEDPTNPPLQYTYLDAGVQRSVDVIVPFDGTLTAIRLHRVADPLMQGGDKRLSVTLSTDEVSSEPLVDVSVVSEFKAPEDNPRGQPYLINVSSTPLEAEQRYVLSLTPDTQGPLVIAGSTIAIESTWDDALPLSVSDYPIWGGLYQGLKMELHWEDTPTKRQRMQTVLDSSDYFVISSNRFYDSLSRNPRRWPMTLAFYRALFSGELGFELVGDFTSRPNLGPIRFHDDTAEEAWTVYDHPRVLIFRKTEAYSSEQTAEVLYSVNLDNVVQNVAPDAKGRPVDLELPAPRIKPQRARSVVVDGTPTQFDPARKDVWSNVQPLTVIVWWLVIGLIGWATVPILWTLFPGLPDRAYPAGRIMGLLLAAWLVWMLASMDVMGWTGWTALLMVLLLAGVSAVIVWRQRPAFTKWLLHSKRYIMMVEIGLAALFLLFVLIRWANPDLWHPVFGGEKPMDLAYFNAVLNSQTFPPYDPWFAGGTINYYYFGFVLVGLPVKLLGIPTAIAYNLIIPTLYAVTGGVAFSTAFNLVARTAPNSETWPEGQEHPLREALKRWPNVTLREMVDAARRARQMRPRSAAAESNEMAYIAGIAAVLLAIVLGNLDEIRTVLWGLAEIGHGSSQWSVTYLPQMGDVWRGLKSVVVDGNPLYSVGLGEWYWNATRVIIPPLGANGAPIEANGPITEFPYFTFLYADLHAHMIAMPLTLTAMLWSVGQIRNARARRDGRERGWVDELAWAILHVFVGALVVGALRPTNTWDYPTYLALGGGALVIAQFVRRGDETGLKALGTGILGAGLLGLITFSMTLQTLENVGSTESNLPIAAGGAAVGLLLGYALGVIMIQLGTDDETDHEPDGLRLWVTLVGGGLRAAAFAGGTALLFLPYIRNYTVGYDRLVQWWGSKTQLWAYLDIHGLFFFIIISWLVLEMGRWLRRLSRQHIVPVLIAVGALVGLTALSASLLSPVAWLALPIIITGLALFFRDGQEAEKRLVLLLMIGALALTLLVEGVVLYGDIGRMNTVFKFYLQVWLVLAIVAGAALGWLWPSLDDAPDVIRVPWWSTAIILISLAALYPLMATRAKVADRWNPNAPRTLDGMAYMQTIDNWNENGEAISLVGDYEAIRWLQENVDKRPVVLEGLSWREYLWGNRFSIYTGYPTVIGWNWHQRQQRPALSLEVTGRRADVQTIYDTSQPSLALGMLRAYDVDLVIVGELERAYYTPQGLDKFERMVDEGMLRVVFQQSGTVIYEVLDGDPAMTGEDQ